MNLTKGHSLETLQTTAYADLKIKRPSHSIRRDSAVHPPALYFNTGYTLVHRDTPFITTKVPVIRLFEFNKSNLRRRFRMDEQFFPLTFIVLLLSIGFQHSFGEMDKT